MQFRYKNVKSIEKTTLLQKKLKSDNRTPKKAAGDMQNGRCSSVINPTKISAIIYAQEIKEKRNRNKIESI